MTTTDETLPLGLYEHLKSASLMSRAIPEGAQWQEEILEKDDYNIPELLTQFFATQLAPALESLKTPADQVELVNRMMELLPQDAEEQNDSLLTDDDSNVIQMRELTLTDAKTTRPDIPLSDVALMTNTSKDLNLNTEIQKELESADRVDLLCSFLKMSGVNSLSEQLKAIKNRGIPFRIITTTYMGATDRKAIDRLVEKYGAEVKISYQGDSTRLHAKAWLFHRNTGMSTGYVGSSNLSSAALTDGLEWNVRISNPITPGLIRQFEGLFESYWKSGDFTLYTASDKEKQELDTVLAKADITGRKSKGLEYDIDSSLLDVHPFPHQARMLEEMQNARSKGRHRNLAVAATGTGKTVFSALDYRRLCEQSGKKLKLLFIAHRKEILDQARRTFGDVMLKGNFGELLTGGKKPEYNEAVFATIQTLSGAALENYAPDYFDVIIMDECHHIEAASWDKVFNYFKPRDFIGLTATPEREDGVNIADKYFDGYVATSIRLWDALEDNLLAPFQYFGIADGTDLRHINIRGGRYDENDLAKRYTDHEDAKRRLRIIVKELREKVDNPLRMKALGFCVNVKHAKYMAQKFNEVGIPADFLVGDDISKRRDEVMKKFMSDDHELAVIFTVDLFNEGVDIPNIDTLLMLRPTQSLTLFLQQLGRGLRRAPLKSVLTVLDFVGHQNKNFMVHHKYRAFVRQGTLTERDIESPELPAGCHFHLDELTQKQVLMKIHESLRMNKNALIDTVKNYLENMQQNSAEPYIRPTVVDFINHYGLGLPQIYGRSSKVTLPGVTKPVATTWTSLQAASGLYPDLVVPFQDNISLEVNRRIKALRHVNDSFRINAYLELLNTNILEQDMTDEQRRHAWMLLFSIWPDAKWVGSTERFSLDEGLATLRKNGGILQELESIWQRNAILDTNSTLPLFEGEDIPLRTHAYYSREELFAGLAGQGASFGVPTGFREGVRTFNSSNTTALVVNLEKSEKHFSPTTMYKDYAISTDEFAWDSQNTTTPESSLGQLFQHHEELGHRIVLFVRRNNKDAIGTRPYMCLGTVKYISHEGSKPMHIRWSLDRPMPASMFQIAKIAS
ncbi:DEAD/DEAH box helicase [Rothia similmucilaginosa]|uniref:DEAD/DEAH box helicase n=1 Tax=Rothia sp. RSM42 TaxID=3030211 RepID=UPI002447B990|nr:DEAD/DEAH box helicase [Rothia sp. RSM42]